jgi:glucose/arabinose dehydrogenase
MKFLTFLFFGAGSLLAQNGKTYAPLPKPPQGWSIRELAQMPEKPIKITTDPAGKLMYVLCGNGDVYRIGLPSGTPTRVLDHKTFAQGEWLFQGMCLDNEGRMYLVGNRTDNDAQPYKMNHVTIFRGRADDQSSIKPWFETGIPFAIDTFQHGVNEIKQGPDGMMYASSGSRTDHGEAGRDPRLSPHGETEHSACMWKLDPRQEKPTVHVFARGLRNPFGFCFDPRP